MKSSDIVIGKTYAYAPFGLSRRNPDSSWNNSRLAPITVKEIVKERVATRGYNAWNSTRLATFVIGTNVVNGKTVTVKTEPKSIVCAWSEVVEARAKAAEWKDEAAIKKAARNAELDPLIAKVEAALVAKGWDTRRHYLGSAYVHGVTGEVVPVGRPADYDVAGFDPYAESNPWSHESLYAESVLDREEILKTGNITLPITLVADLLPPF